MAHYFVGDIQGCFSELRALLDHVDFNPSKDELWSVGDLVARGPDSLKVMDFFCSLKDAAKVVLGNHDLHLLAVLSGLKQPNPQDKLEQLIHCPHKSKFVEFIRHQPLMRFLPEFNLIMTHAGVPPQWTLETLTHESNLVSNALTQQDYLESLIAKMYTKEPSAWRSNLSKLERQIFCINGLTRMRYLHQDGSMDFQCKMPPEKVTNSELKPWFTFPSLLPKETKIVFGHWAALMGETQNKQRLALDTGCCWGEYMTLWHLETDEKITQPCLIQKHPKTN